MKEITIIGGGLAGLSLGIALRRSGVPVRVREAGSYPRHRVCGEFINGVTLATLQRLGIDGVFAGVRRHRTTRWFLGETPLYATTLEEPALGLSRYRLDEALARLLVESGGVLETGCRVPRGAAEGQVWAAGRKPERESDWLGLKVHLTGVEMTADLEMHLGRRGYLGLAPVEDGRVNACGLFHRQEVRGRGVELLWEYLARNGLEGLRERLRCGRVEEKSFTGVSAFHLGTQEAEEDLCVLGDAESMIPPFTGNGMSMAFEAAELACGPLRRYASGGGDWPGAVAAIREGLRERFRTRLFTARLLHPLLFSEFGRMMLAASARSGVLPFRPLARMLK